MDESNLSLPLVELCIGIDVNGTPYWTLKSYDPQKSVGLMFEPEMVIKIWREMAGCMGVPFNECGPLMLSYAKGIEE